MKDSQTWDPDDVLMEMAGDEGPQGRAVRREIRRACKALSAVYADRAQGVVDALSELTLAMRDDAATPHS